MSGNQLEMLAGWHNVAVRAESTNEQRLQALKSIEDAKEVLGWDCGEAGIAIMGKVDVNDGLHYFGLHLLEEAVERYYEGRDESRVVLRGKIMEAALKMGTCPNRTSEKLGQVIADIAKQDWPARWGDFIPQLLQVPMVIVSKTLRSLLEDLKEASTVASTGTSKWDKKSHLPAPRKRELVTAVREISADLLTYLHTHLQSPDAHVASIQCLTSLISLVDSAVIINSGVPQTVTTLLMNTNPQSDSWQVIAECVAELGSIPSDSISCVLAAVSTLAHKLSTTYSGKPCPDECAHLVLMETCKCLSALISNKVLMNDAAKVLEVVKACLGLLKIPSLPVAENLLPCLLLIVKARYDSEMKELPVLLREALADNISDPESEGGLAFPNISWSEVVYDYDEWKSALAGAKRDGRAILMSLTKSDPVFMVNTMLTLAKELGTFQTRHPSDPLDFTGELHPCSRQAVAWESSTFVITSCLSALGTIPQASLEQAPVKELVESLSSALSIETSDSAVIMAVADLIGGLGSLYKTHPNQLVSLAFEKLFKLMQHRRDFEAGSTVLSPATSDARKKVMNAYIKICSTLPSQLLQFVHPLMERASALVASNELLPSETSSLYEGLVIISNMMPAEGQSALLETLIKPSLALMGEMSHMSSVQSLAALLQRPTAPDSSVSKILHMLNTLTGVFRHCKGTVLKGLAEQLASTMLQAAQSVSYLHGKQKEALPAVLHPMLAVENSDNGSWQYATGDEQATLTLIDDGRNFMSSSRVLLFELLSYIAVTTPVLHEHYVTSSVGAIGEGLSVDSARELLFHFAPRFVYSCPPQLLESAAKFFNGSCKMAADSITTWYLQYSESEDRRVVYETASLAIDLIGRPVKANQGQEEGAVSNYLMTNPISCTGILLVVNSSLVWGDAQPAVRALGVLKKMLPVIVQAADLHQHIYVIYGNCIKRLLQAELSDGINGLVGCNSKEDSLLSECVAAISLMLCTLGPVHSVFVSALRQAGVPESESLDAVFDPQEGRRVSFVRSIVSKYIAGRNKSRTKTPVNLALPSFASHVKGTGYFDDPTPIPVS